MEIIRWTESGPIVEEKQFDIGIVAPTVKKMIAKYGLRYDGKTIVPDDNDSGRSGI